MRREYEAAALEMALSGNTAEEIATYFGYTSTTDVLKFVRKENIQLCKPIPLYGKQETKNRALEMESQGIPRLDIALNLGVSYKSLDRICGPKNNKTTDHEHALQLILEGYTAKEIVEVCGYSNISCVFNLAKSHGLKVAKEHSKIHAEMRAYKAEGHTMGEVAEQFGVTKPTAQRICKGISPQKPKPPKNGYHPTNKGVLQNIEEVKRIINERAPGFEYAGDYTGSNGSVKLRCKICGGVITRSWVAVRHGIEGCQHCAELERKRNKGLAELQKIKEREANRISSIQNKRGKEVVKLLKHITKLHRCPVCGELTTNKTYCSSKCMNKAHWSAKDAQRRILIKTNLIDRDINLERLYRRDKGVCCICGKPCDWEDSHWEGNTFIVGRNYPSIDHIVPLSKGGEHSWNNVQLAHFGCNSAKGAKLVG